MEDPVAFFQEHGYAVLSQLNVGRIKEALNEVQLLSESELYELEERGKRADRSDLYYLFGILRQKSSFCVSRFLKILAKIGYTDLLFAIKAACTLEYVSNFLSTAALSEEQFKPQNLIVRGGKVQQIRDALKLLSVNRCTNGKAIICGPAGVGKTVLIVQAVSCSWIREECFGDGIIWKTHGDKEVAEDIMRSIVRLNRGTYPEVSELSGKQLQRASMSVAMTKKLLVIVDDAKDDSFLRLLNDIPMLLLISTQNTAIGKDISEEILHIDVSRCTDDEAKEIVIKCSDWPNIPENVLNVAIGECHGSPFLLAKLGETLSLYKTKKFMEKYLNVYPRVTIRMEMRHIRFRKHIFIAGKKLEGKERANEENASATDTKEEYDGRIRIDWTDESDDGSMEYHPFGDELMEHYHPFGGELIKDNYKPFGGELIKDYHPFNDDLMEDYYHPFGDEAGEAPEHYQGIVKGSLLSAQDKVFPHSARHRLSSPKDSPRRQNYAMMSKHTNETETEFQNDSRSVSESDALIFYGNALFISATPIWLFWRIHQMDPTSAANLFVVMTTISTFLVSFAYKNSKFSLKQRICQKRKKEITHAMPQAFDDIRTTKQEHEERILLKEIDQRAELSWFLQILKEEADYEATMFSIFYNNAIYLLIVVMASFFLLPSFTSELNYILTIAAASGLVALFSTSTT